MELDNNIKINEKPDQCYFLNMPENIALVDTNSPELATNDFSIKLKKLPIKIAVFGVALKCGKCPKVFINQSDLEAHRKKNHRGKKFYCRPCKVNFKSRSGMMAHKDLKHQKEGDKRKNPCHKCWRSFNLRESYLRHVKSHDLLIKKMKNSNNVESYPCISCDKIYISSHGLSLHKDSRHNDLTVRKKYSCGKCSISFNYEPNLKSHFKLEHVEKKKNVAIKDSNGFKSFSCNFCERVFNNKRTYLLHNDYENHAHGQNMKKNKKHLCHQCPLSFNIEYNLTRHLSIEHGCKTSKPKAIKIGEPKSYPCDLCEKVFKTSAGRGYHRDCHHRTETSEFKKYLCSSCPMSYGYEINLLQHLKTHEPDNVTEKPKSPKEWPCEQCNVICSTRSKLRRHIDYKHQGKGERKYPCSDCHRSFGLKENLERHLSCHRSFPRAGKATERLTCKVCGIMMTTFNAVLNHEDFHHDTFPPEMKKHHCQLCTRSFRFLTSLKRHVKQNCNIATTDHTTKLPMYVSETRKSVRTRVPLKPDCSVLEFSSDDDL